MTVLSRTVLSAAAQVIKNETSPEANTATRIGQMNQDEIDSYQHLQDPPLFPAVHIRYTDIAQLFAGQSSQFSGMLYFVQDASAEGINGFAYYEYLGTTVGDITDYKVNYDSSREGLPPNVVEVNVKADFPTPVSTVITLAANTLYWVVDPAVDLGTDTLKFSNGSTLIGLSAAASGITTNSVNALIDVPVDITADVDTLTLTNTGGDVINVGVVAGLQTRFQVFKCNVIPKSTSTGIVLNDVGSFILDLCAIIGGAKAVEVNGVNNGSITVNLCGIVNYTSIGFDFTGSLSELITLLSVNFTSITAASNAIGTDTDADTDVSDRAVLADISLNGAGGPWNKGGSPAIGLGLQNNKWEVLVSFGFSNSTEYGLLGFSGNVTETVIAVINTYVDVNATWLVSSSTARFTEPSNGVLEAMGIWTYGAEMSAEASVSVVGGGTKDLTLGLFYKASGGSFVLIREASVEADAKGRTLFMFEGVAKGIGDQYKLMVKNETDTANVLVESAGLKVVRLT